MSRDDDRVATVQDLAAAGGETGRDVRASGETRLELLGTWRLTDDLDRVVLPANARRLIALLALAGARSRAYVAGCLWPESAEALALGNLRATVSRLKRSRPGVLLVEPGTLALAPSVNVDVHYLHRVADDVLHGDGDVPPGALPVLADAELLPGWYDDFVLLHRERLEQLRLHALEALADRLCAQGDYPEAVAAALAAIQAEPLRESAHRTLMRVHLAEGNPAAALRQFRSFRDRVRREIGMEPSPRMLALVPARVASAR